MEKRKLGQARALRVFLCTYTHACTAWMRRGGARNMHFQVILFCICIFAFFDSYLCVGLLADNETRGEGEVKHLGI